jgi:hypothetical protein
MLLVTGKRYLGPVLDEYANHYNTRGHTGDASKADPL